MPGTYRNQPGFEPGASGTRTRLLSEGDTGAQPHATCRGVSALDAESAVLGWQDADPFYNYVPFQKAAAGLEDDPALWIEDVLALTGVNLGQVSDVAAQAATELEALCEAPAVGGTFYPADQTQTSTASLNSGFAHDLTTPLTAQIAQLQADLTGANAAQTSAQSSLAAQTSAKSSLEAQNTALTAQVAQLKLEATRLKINSVSGGSVKLAGPAGKAVTIKMTISKTVAKALKLKSRTLATATGKIGSTRRCPHDQAERQGGRSPQQEGWGEGDRHGHVRGPRGIDRDHTEGLAGTLTRQLKGGAGPRDRRPFGERGTGINEPSSLLHCHHRGAFGSRSRHDRSRPRARGRREDQSQAGRVGEGIPPGGDHHVQRPDPARNGACYGA